MRMSTQGYSIADSGVLFAASSFLRRRTGIAVLGWPGNSSNPPQYKAHRRVEKPSRLTSFVY